MVTGPQYSYIRRSASAFSSGLGSENTSTAPAFSTGTASTTQGAARELIRMSASNHTTRSYSRANDWLKMRHFCHAGERWLARAELSSGSSMQMRSYPCLSVYCRQFASQNRLQDVR